MTANWYKEYLNTIKDTVEKIPEEDKPKVYYESGKYSAYSDIWARVGVSGGKNIFSDLKEGYGSVDPEAVIERDPDIIIRSYSGADGSGYHLDADDTAEIEKIRAEIMSRPELQNVKAVKEGRVYVIWGHITIGCRGFVQAAYMAKWFHPELFEELGPKAIHQEYLARFQGLDIDLDEKGVFVYPEEPV